MNIINKTTHQLMQTFVTNVVDISFDEPQMVRLNMDHEILNFVNGNVKQIKECIIEEPHMYGLEDDIDVLAISVVTPLGDLRYLCVIEGSEMQF